MTIDPVENALRQVLYENLRKRKFLPLQTMNESDLIFHMEEIASDIFKFFSSADSFDPSWPIHKVDEKENGLFSRPEAQEALFHISYDATEIRAAEAAERGDFRALETLIEERGFLRTSRARRLAVGRMRGEKKAGRPKTPVNEDTLTQIIVTMARFDCSEYRAKKLWLDDNPDVGIEALDKRLKKAKKESVIWPIIKAATSSKKQRD